MKAIVHSTYGSPDVLELREVEKPDVANDGVLVRVRAASINPADWYGITGRPWVARPTMGLRKPKSPEVGADIAGTVEAVGKDVTQFRPGDDVFGRSGTFGEYVCVAEDRAVLKPANVTFEQAAAVPVAALTALQALRDHGRVQPGHNVLVNGASGGVGTFAVQIARALGATVTAVCSTRNVDLVRSLGADRVIDYTRKDFTRTDQRYDLLLDIAGSRSWREYKRILHPQATLVIIGAPKGTRLLGPLSHIARVKLASVRSSRKVVFFVAKILKADLEVLRELLESGQITPVVDKRYELSETADAFRYLGEGHAQGKIVIVA
jgi:NADPH:quinone reductase-like Zn-dependent oxidoreductase